jgi:sigma-54 dependent transcriptional regulator
MPSYPVPKQSAQFPPQRSAALPICEAPPIFEDPRSKALLERIQKLAPSDANALIVGKTGTGKELIARLMHKLSHRAHQPFVAVNCGAFSESLVESELFGHERGSFTGASETRVGWFEAADRGTLFLDEIGDLPFPMQVKLLRVLQERQVVRIGSRVSVPVDVRVVAATNVELEEAVASGRFREDLYYRLRVAIVHVPPLCERRGDILPLVHYFLHVYGKRLGLDNPVLSPEATDVVVNEHHWPGNIRELENAIHQALLVCRGAVIEPEDLHLSTLASRPALATSGVPPQDLKKRFAAILAAFFSERRLHLDSGGLEQPGLYADLEASILRAAYEHCHRNQVQTARLLGISRNVLRAKLQQCGELPRSSRRMLARFPRSPQEPHDANHSGASGSTFGVLL